MAASMLIARRSRAICGAIFMSLRQSGNAVTTAYSRSPEVDLRTPAARLFGGHPSRRQSTGGDARPEVDYSKLVPVTRQGGKTESYNAVWLRENCRCEACCDVWQRTVVYHRLPPEAFAASHVTLTGEEGVVEVTWADGHLSRYPVEWLDTNTNPKPLYHNPETVPRVYWDGSLSLDSLPTVDYVQLLEQQRVRAEGLSETPANGPALKQLLTNLLRYGFAFVDNTPANVDDTMAATGAISFPQTTFYGEKWIFGAGGDAETESQDVKFADRAYTTSALGLHTDGTYLSQPPGIQALHLLRHVGGSGGETVLVDGFRTAHLLRERDPASFSLLCTARLEHHNVDRKCRHSYRSRDTTIRVDPHSGNVEWIRYNPYDRSPAPVSDTGDQGPVYGALASLSRLLEDPRAALKFQLRPGRLLLMDNWRVLHSRTAFTGHREMCGCYLPRDDWLNKARQMALL